MSKSDLGGRETACERLTLQLFEAALQDVGILHLVDEGSGREARLPLHPPVLHVSLDFSRTLLFFFTLALLHALAHSRYE